MVRYIKKISPMLIIFFILFQHCARTNKVKTLSDFKTEIADLKIKLHKNSQDETALRDIGFICFDVKDYPNAVRYLVKASKSNPFDPRTMFYLGVAYERMNQLDMALLFYERYNKVPANSPYRMQLEGRYHLLARQLTNVTLKNAAIENKAPDSSSQKIVIMPPAFKGGDEKYALVGLGLNELMIHDIKAVGGFEPVAALKLQALLKETNLNPENTFDNEFAMRLANTLQASKIIQGAYLIEEQDIVMEFACWDIESKSFQAVDTSKGPIGDLFFLEKEIVFSLTQKFGLKLTPLIRVTIEDNAPRHFDAFIEFCKGLDRESADQYTDAADFFQKAMALDPDFDLAAHKLHINQTIAAIQKNKDMIPPAMGHKNQTREGGVVFYQTE